MLVCARGPYHIYMCEYKVIEFIFEVVSSIIGMFWRFLQWNAVVSKMGVDRVPSAECGNDG